MNGDRLVSLVQQQMCLCFTPPLGLITSTRYGCATKRTQARIRPYCRIGAPRVKIVVDIYNFNVQRAQQTNRLTIQRIFYICFRRSPISHRKAPSVGKSRSIKNRYVTLNPSFQGTPISKLRTNDLHIYELLQNCETPSRHPATAEALGQQLGD